MDIEKFTWRCGYWFARGYWSAASVLDKIPGFEAGTHDAYMADAAHDWDEPPRTLAEQFSWLSKVGPDLLSRLMSNPEPKPTWTQADDDLMNPGEDAPG